MKFGLWEIIRPLSAERIYSERMQYIFGEPKNKVEKVSESTHIEKFDDVLVLTAKAAKNAHTGGSDYTAIEFFTDARGITRINVCHMKVVPNK
jgi:hypothetical protein